jgi:hypothetical protein
LNVEAIAVVGGPEVRAYCAGRVDRIVDAAEDGVENIRRALGAFAFERLVYLTSDIPFVDGPGLADFVARSDGSAVTMALGDADAYDAAFPAAPPHAVSLGQERVANGSVFTIAQGCPRTTRARRRPFLSRSQELAAPGAPVGSRALSALCDQTAQCRRG